MNDLEFYSNPHVKDAYGDDVSKVYFQPDKRETVEEKMYQKIL